MNTEIKTKWAEALRSGRYQQCTGRLRASENSYCCLGVLCDIIDSTKWAKIGPTWDKEYYYDNLITVLPTGVVDITSIESEEEGNLIRMNDEYKNSFSQIADYIEKTL